MDESQENRAQSDEKLFEKDLVDIARGSGVTFVGKLFGNGIKYLTLVILGRLLGTESFGLYTLGMAVMDVFSRVSQVGMNKGALRYISIYHDKKDPGRIKGIITETLGFSFVAGCTGGGIIFLSSELVANKIFHSPGMTGVLRLFSLGIPLFSTVCVAVFATRGFQIARYYVYVTEFIRPISNLFLIFILFGIGLGLHGTVIARVLSMGLGLFAALYYTKKSFLRKVRKYADTSQSIKPLFEIRKLLSYTFPLTLTGIVGPIMGWIDTFMLGALKTAKEVGVYRAANYTAVFVSIVLQAFNSIFFPKIASLHEKGEVKQLEHLFKTTTKWILYFSLPVFVVMISLSGEILSIFGVEFKVGAVALLFLASAQIISAGVGGIGGMLTMSGHSKEIFYTNLGSRLVNVALNLLLIPKYGVLGAAVATGISIALLNLVRLLLVYIYLGVHPYDSRYIKLLIASFSSFLIVLILKNFIVFGSYISTLVCFVPIAVLTFLSVIFIFGFDEEDKMILRKLGSIIRKT